MASTDTNHMLEAPDDLKELPEVAEKAKLVVGATVEEPKTSDQEAFNKFADKDDSSDINRTPLSRGNQPPVEQVDSGLDTISGLREAGKNRDAADQLTDFGNHVASQDATSTEQEPK